MAVAPETTSATSPKAKPRRRFQFSLRTALFWMFLASIIFGCFLPEPKGNIDLEVEPMKAATPAAQV